MTSGIKIRILHRTAAQGKQRGSAGKTYAPNLPNLADSFLNCCQANRSKPAIKDVSGAGCSYDYQQMESHAIAFAKTLCSNGNFRIGDRIGICFPNSAEYVVAFYGTLIAGGVVVPLPFYETENQLTKLCELADLNFLACGTDASRFENSFEHAATIDEQAYDIAEAYSAALPGGDSLAMLMFTSGSTGDSKAVMLSHRNLLANYESICEYLPITSDDRALAVMPFYHAFGNSVMQTHLLTGGSLVVGVDKSFSTTIIKAIQMHDCTSLSAVPEIFDHLANAHWSEGTKQQLNYMSVAGGPMDVNRARSLCKNLDPVPFYIMYGQTEATARLAYLPPEHLNDTNNPESQTDAVGASNGVIGCPIPGVQLEIRDDDGNPSAVNGAGVLYAKGDNVMLGYWRDPSTTAETLVDGWLRTGDLAILRDDGMIQLCGRNSNLIKIQGHRIHPREIEQRIIQELPMARAIVIDFEFYGKTRLALFVVNNDGDRATTTIQELRSICKLTLPAHMVPQRYTILKNWPLNSACKVDRLALRRSLSTPNMSTEPVKIGRVHDHVQTPAHSFGE